jgi:SAM-dependent methyltransferase
MSTAKNEQRVATGLKEFFKKSPRFYYFVYDYLGPLYFGGLSANDFLKKYSVGEKCFNLGSGTRVISKKIINIDSTQYPNVDIVADITKLPLVDGEASAVVCEEVLEHVQKPEVAVKEIERILSKGGYAYITVPFLYPYHASPDDYTRWSHVGFRELLSSFEVVELDVRSGPFSVFTVNACYFFATLFSFGNKHVYWMLVYAFTFLFFPIKFLDVIGNRLPQSINMAALLYCVVRKK